jgi:hypothetical protein
MNPKACFGTYSASPLRGSIPSAAQDCSIYPFRRVTFRLHAALSEWEFHNNGYRLYPPLGVGWLHYLAQLDTRNSPDSPWLANFPALRYGNWSFTDPTTLRFGDCSTCQFPCTSLWKLEFHRPHYASLRGLFNLPISLHISLHFVMEIGVSQYYSF